MPSDKTREAYNIASQAAYAILNSCEESIRERIKNGEIKDEESLSDAIHEEADESCMYTADQYALVWGLRDREDAIEEGLSTPQNFGEALAAQAYCNLRFELLQIDFSDAFAVAEDAAEEAGEL